MSHWPLLTLLLLALFSPAVVRAQASIATDRPDFTDSPYTIQTGIVQAELGATYERSGGADAVSGPELLVRWSPVERVELRFVSPDYVAVDGASGFSDPTLGVKVTLGETGGWGFGTIATVLVPIGDSTYSTGGLDPALTLTAARDLTPSVELGTQIGATWDTAAEQINLGATLVVGTSLTDHLGTFLEVAADALQDDPALTLHHGYTYGLSPDVQVDLHAGVGLTSGAPDFLIGAGLSVRR